MTDDVTPSPTESGTDAESDPVRPLGADALLWCPVNLSACLGNVDAERLTGDLDALGARVCFSDPDPDHNRTVLSILASPPALQKAILHLYEWALVRVDLRVHRGVHPRVGAVDVVPLVPVRGATRESCRLFARRLGREIAEQFDVPVYLYGESAVDPFRASVSSIRSGGPAGLKARMGAGGDWWPDFGPRDLHPSAGASIVGVREPLVAYNVWLRGDDLAAARRIAKAVRGSSGGRAGLMAIGVFLGSRKTAQVAMNLTRVTAGVLGEVFELVSDRAKEEGEEVDCSELIGLVPELALPGDGDVSPLRVRNWSDLRILERQVEAMQEERSGG